MREYAKIYPQFWLGETGKKIKLMGAEATVVSLYLLTSPHANMLGLYYIPLVLVTHETGLTSQGASKGLDRCIEAGFCSYDHITETVFVYEMAKYQIEAQLKDTDNRVKGINSAYKSLHKNPFLGDFFDLYKDRFHLVCKRGDEAPSKPLASQEQEQEQEQEELCDEPSLDDSPPEDVPQDDFKTILTIPLIKKDGKHPVTDSDIATYADTFPGIDVVAELKKCRLWNTNNPAKRKTKQGIKKHIGTWLGRAQDNSAKNGTARAGDGWI